MTVRENADRRVLGAVRFIDRTTRAMVTQPLDVSATNATLIPNRSGLYVITQVDGLERHVEAFAEPPEEPPANSIEVSLFVQDRRRQYLPRRVTINVPRDATRVNRDNADSLFQPVNVQLYPRRSMPLTGNASAVRAVVTRDGAPVPGALVRVTDPSITPPANAVLSSGITDEEGEVLVVLTGVPITLFSDPLEPDTTDADGDTDADPDTAPATDAVVVSRLPITIEVSEAAEPVWPVDADDLEDNHTHITTANIPTDLELSTGATLRVPIRLEP